MPEDVIETLNEWNTRLLECGCCPMYICETPVKECEAISGSAESKGYKKDGDTSFFRYAKKTVTKNYNVSESNTATDPYIGTYTTETQTSHADYSSITTYNQLFDAFVGGLTPCDSVSATSTEECLSTGTLTTETYATVGAIPNEANPTPACVRQVYHYSTESQTRSMIFSEANCAANLWRDSGTFTRYEPSGACGDGGSTETPFDLGYSNSSDFAHIGTVYTNFINSNPPVVTDTDVLSDSQNYDALIGSMKSWISSHSNFETVEDTCIESNCNGSIYSVTPNSGNSDIVMSTRILRFRWKIPDLHTGTYFKITWDILNEPTGWNTTTLPRTFYAEDQTYEWTGETERYSEWYNIPIPDIAGQRRIVNIRYECYKTTNYGNKPQTTGEAVELPDT